MGNGKRSAAAQQRRAEKKVVKVEQKNKLARLEEPNWICVAANTYGKECGNSNFARRAACNICKAPNPLRIGPNKTRPQKVKQPKPEKQSSWRKNPTALDIEENERLRLLLDEEKTTSIVCSELIGEIRVRAEVVWKKQLERQKHIEARKKKKNLMKAKKGTAPGGGSTDAGSVDSTHEQSGKDVIIKKEEEEQVMVPKDKKKNKDEKKRKEKVNAVVKEDVECETVVEAEVKASRKKSRSEGETSEERDARKKSRSEGETSEERAARKALKKKKREQADAE